MTFRLILEPPLPMGALVPLTVVPPLVINSPMIGAEQRTVANGAYTLAIGIIVNTKLNLCLISLLIGKPNMTTYGAKSQLIPPFQPTTPMP